MGLGWISVACCAFYLSYWSPWTAPLAVVYLFALTRLSFLTGGREAYYSALAVGVIVAAGELTFFWKIFGAGSIALWWVYAFWIALFVASARRFRLELPRWAAFCAIPLAWCGLEYFRSELYYLRFSWLSPGLAFEASNSSAALHLLGVYGIGFVLMLAASLAAWMWERSKMKSMLLLVSSLALVAPWQRLRSPDLSSAKTSELSVAGVQLEFPTEREVLLWLNKLAVRHPEAQLLVLSEYTIMGPMPKSLIDWCREHQRYLVVGAETPVSTNTFYNTAFVISPGGEIVFRQEKSVPIQFFKDGLPAREQRVWDSPWGKIGICICYDLSYSRVTDRLIQLGAEAIIVPTMDVDDWGRRQHELHARIGPARAAEYGIPIFRLASSGISQIIGPYGNVLCSAPFPGQGSMLDATIPMAGPGHRPLDRWLAPVATVITAAALAILALRPLLMKVRRTR
jgi:apolipoprotein N-acyltransferase